MKLTTLLKWLFTLVICTTVCVVLSPLAQKAPVAARREPVSPEKININTATVDQLESLPHIGTKTAQAIIAYRIQHGPFKKAADLTKVRGIGEKTFEELKEHIILEDDTVLKSGHCMPPKRSASIPNTRCGRSNTPGRWIAVPR